MRQRGNCLSHHPHPIPIRVVQVIDRLNIGGPAKIVVWLTAALNQGEFETVLVTGVVPGGEGDMGYFAEDAGVRPVVIRELSREVNSRDLFVIAKLFRLFCQLRPDIIHTHKAKAGAAGRAAAWLYRWLTPSSLWLQPRACKVVHTYHGHIFHGYYGPAKTRLFLAIERAMARLVTDRIIALSARQCDELAQRYQIGRPQQFRVIPLGLDLGESLETHGRLRRELGISVDIPLVGFVGRLCEVKNLPMFLAVAQRLTRDGIRAKYVLIGDGHLRPQLEERVRALNLVGTVIFVGFRRDALALYADLDVVALTSLNEGTPLTMIEGMAAGRAVAATDVGGVTDLLGGRQHLGEGFVLWEHGMTAPSGDVEAYARGLRHLLEHPALRDVMGRHGQSFVRTHLSRERLAQDVAALYRELAVSR